MASRIMELIHGRVKEPEFAPQVDVISTMPNDVISSMPDDVISNILDRLAIQDAVRTGILSRNWRFKWTLLTQLIFDKGFGDYLLRKGGNYKYYGRIISRLLLHIKGPITKFVLYMHYGCESGFDEEDINHWIMFLSTKGIKEFILVVENNEHTESPRLHTHIFSCAELIHLELRNCYFNPMPNFRGFPNLLSLDFSEMYIESDQVIARCPSLEILKISDYHLTTNVIAKLVNLKSFYFPLSALFNEATTPTSSGIIRLMGCLTKLEDLNIDFQGYKDLAEETGGAEKKHATMFPCLRSLTLSEVAFTSDIMVSLVVDMICGSPNLQTLAIKGAGTDDARSYAQPPAVCFSDFESNKMGQLRVLESVVFEFFSGLANEVCLIKYLLASSPLLKKIVIKPNPNYLLIGGDRGKFNFARKLLKLHRASPTAEIQLY